MPNLPKFVSDDEDFWRLDPETNLYHMIDLEGNLYHWATHPPASYEVLVENLPLVREAAEVEVLWRALRFTMARLDGIPGT